MTTENDTTPTLSSVYDELDQIYFAYDTLQSLIGSADFVLPTNGLAFLLGTVNQRLETLKNSISYPK